MKLRGKQTDPFGKRADPTGKQTDPNGKLADPSGKQTDPFGKQTDPTGKQADPIGKPADPFGKQADPKSASAAPSEGKNRYRGSSTPFVVRIDSLPARFASLLAICATPAPKQAPGLPGAVLSRRLPLKL